VGCDWRDEIGAATLVTKGENNAVVHGCHQCCQRVIG
jgi:hypothetical protein